MGKKNQVMEFVSVKKKNKGRTLLKIIVVVAAVKGAMKVISMYKEKQSKAQEDQNDVEGVKTYFGFMNGQQIRLDEEEVETIHLKATMSGIDLDLRHAIIPKELFITGKLMLSGLSIRVPENVKVKTNCSIKLGACNNTVPSYLEEELPTIYIELDAFMSGIDVRVGIQEENIEEVEDEEDSENAGEDIFEEVDTL